MTRHGRACPGHPRRRAAASQDEKPRILSLFLNSGISFTACGRLLRNRLGMAGTSPAMAAVNISGQSYEAAPLSNPSSTFVKFRRVSSKPFPSFPNFSKEIPSFSKLCQRFPNFFLGRFEWNQWVIGRSTRKRAFSKFLRRLGRGTSGPAVS
jgi:hypothetical protein